MAEPFIHRCTIRSGNMAGNKLETAVTPIDIEYSRDCDNCGRPLFEPNELLAHIYTQLLELKP